MDIQERTRYGREDGLPEGVRLAVTTQPIGRGQIGWTVCAVDPYWNHVAAMDVQWSNDTGEPGYWVPVPDGQWRLIVTHHATGDDPGERHPELDNSLHPDAETAMRVAWDAGLLEVIVFPAY